MNKRTIGKLFLTMGQPSEFALNSVSESFMPDGKYIHLIWSIPLALATLPLLFVNVKGSNLLLEAGEEEFARKIDGLPRMQGPLPRDHVMIEAHLVDDQTLYYLNPFDYSDGEEPFETEDEARLFLSSFGYHEVVPVDAGMYQQTYWIK
jgi:hypothetical protein